MLVEFVEWFVSSKAGSFLVYASYMIFQTAKKWYTKLGNDNQSLKKNVVDLVLVLTIYYSLIFFIKYWLSLVCVAILAFGIHKFKQGIKVKIR